MVKARALSQQSIRIDRRRPDTGRRRFGHVARTARETDTWKRFTGEKLSVSTLVRLCGEAGLEECSTEVMDELREQEELPEGATMVQVIKQFEQVRTHANRYDVTILVNGLPLVQIELQKTRCRHPEGVQSAPNRYSKESFNSENSLYRIKKTMEPGQNSSK